MYLVKSIILVQALFIVTKTGPELPPTGLIVVMVAYALLSTVGALHFTVIKRLHRQYKLNATGKLSRLNRKWLATLVGIFILSLVSAFLFVLESPKWDAFEWALTVAAIPVYYVVFRFARKAAQKEYAARFDRAKAMRVSFWVVGVILCLLYATIGLFGQHAMDSLTLEETLNSIPAPFKDSPSALMTDLDKLSCFANGLTAFGLAQVSDTSFLVAFICRFVVYAAVFFGLMNLFNFCLLTAQEIKEEFQPLETDQNNGSIRSILVRYILALAGISVVFVVLFMAFEGIVEKTQADENKTKIETFVTDRASHLIYIIDGHYEINKRFDEIKAPYDQERDRIVGERKAEAVRLINEYYDRCLNNIDSYLDWRDNPLLLNFTHLLGDKAMKDELKKQLTKNADDTLLIQEYNAIQEQLKEPRAALVTELEQHESDIPSDKRLQLEAAFARESKLTLWSVFEGNSENPVIDGILNPEDGTSRDELKQCITDLINEARAYALTEIDGIA